MAIDCLNARFDPYRSACGFSFSHISRLALEIKSSPRTTGYKQALESRSKGRRKPVVQCSLWRLLTVPRLSRICASCKLQELRTAVQAFKKNMPIIQALELLHMWVEIRSPAPRMLSSEAIFSALPRLRGSVSRRSRPRTSFSSSRPKGRDARSDALPIRFPGYGC